MVGDGGQVGAEEFEPHRRRLLALAYRMLGSAADAEDLVQEAWLRLHRASGGGNGGGNGGTGDASDTGTESIRDLPAWLTTTVTRLALDQLRSSRHRRERYVGPWLPEPIVSAGGDGATGAPDPGDMAVLADEVSYALLVVLETLTPAQRAAFVLHDTFGVPFDDIARMLGRTPAACRQLASRARVRVARAEPVAEVDPTTHLKVVGEFVHACQSGRVDTLVALLDPSVVYRSDGGGLVSTAINPVTGADRVARLILGILARTTATIGIEVAVVNGAPGLLVREDGQVTSVVAFTLATPVTDPAGRTDPVPDGAAPAAAGVSIREINVVRNPEKLARLHDLPDPTAVTRRRAGA